MSKMLTALLFFTASQIAFAESQYFGTDYDLNKIYQTVIKSVDKDTLKKIKQSQRSWLKFRDDTCSIYADEKGYYADAALECIDNENNLRIKFLKSFI